jgi:hypothetical protein
MTDHTTENCPHRPPRLRVKSLKEMGEPKAVPPCEPDGLHGHAKFEWLDEEPQWTFLTYYANGAIQFRTALKTANMLGMAQDLARFYLQAIAAGEPVEYDA